MMFANIKAGDTVFVVWSRRRKDDTPKPETVDKVGRKWAFIGREKFDLETGRLDGGQHMSPGTAWPFMEAIQKHLERLQAESDLKAIFGAFGSIKFPHLTTSEIHEITAKLKGTI